MGSKAAVFTLSATVTITSAASNAVGIACCMDASNNAVAVQVGIPQNILVYKYDGSVLQQLQSVTNSFVSPTVNIITVSKRDSTFNVFCNGHYITTFYVSTAKFIGGGDIGLLVPAKGQAIIDNVVMTDQYQAGSPTTCFSDNFSDVNHTGWYMGLLSGQSQSANGEWTLNNSDATMTSIVFVNGIFDRASYKAITKYKSGHGMYGIAMVIPVAVAGGTTYKSYSFLIDSLRHYGYGHPDSTLIKLSPPKTFIHASTGDGKDTLEVLRGNKKYTFRINGVVAEDSITLRGDGSVASAGLFVMPQTAVGYDSFIIGGDSTGASCAIITISAKPKAFTPGIGFAGNEYMLFDVTGRLVKRINSPDAKNLPRMPVGMYFVRKISTNEPMTAKGLMLVR
jgi:hypothetical protein